MKQKKVPTPDAGHEEKFGTEVHDIVAAPPRPSMAKGARVRASRRRPLLDEDELFERARRAWLRGCDIPIQPQNDRRLSADGNTITLSNVNGKLAVYRATGNANRVVVREVRSSGRPPTSGTRKTKSVGSAVPNGRRRQPKSGAEAKPTGGARAHAGNPSERARDTLTKLREMFSDDHRHCEDPEFAPLIHAIDGTGWIVTTASCSRLHEEANAPGVGFIDVAVCLQDVGRLATLLRQLQLEGGEDGAWVFECSLTFEQGIFCPCCVAGFADIAFFTITMELWGHTAAEAKPQLSSLAELIAKVA